MLAQTFKGQSPQERSRLRRELSLSNCSSCCCWTFPLLSDCYCLILKSTDCFRHGIGFLEINAPLQSVTAYGQWNLFCRPALGTAAVNTADSLREGWELQVLPEGSVTALLNPPCWDRAHLGSACPCPGSLSCSELQPAGKQGLPPDRTALQGQQGQTGTPARLGVHRHSVLCPALGAETAVSTGPPLQCSPAMQHSCPSSTGLSLTGPVKKCSSQSLQPPRASEEQRARPKYFCAGSCISFNCNCFKFLSRLETWGPTRQHFGTIFQSWATSKALPSLAQSGSSPVPKQENNYMWHFI